MKRVQTITIHRDTIRGASFSCRKVIAKPCSCSNNAQVNIKSHRTSRNDLIRRPFHNDVTGLLEVAGNCYEDQREDLERIGFDHKRQKIIYSLIIIKSALLRCKEKYGNNDIPDQRFSTAQYHSNHFPIYQTV